LVVATSDAARENVMADPVSISVKQVSAVAKASVKKAIEGSAAPFLIPNYTGRLHPAVLVARYRHP